MCQRRSLFALMGLVLLAALERVDGRATVSIAGMANVNQPWQRHPRMSPAEKRRDNIRRSMYQEDPREHFLDDEDWMTDSRVRTWDPRPKRRLPGQPSLTSKIIFSNIVTFAIQTLKPSFTEWGVKLSDKILRGEQLYRLLTPVFLHGSIFHLLTNMYSLNNVGGISQNIFGNGRFMAMYLVSGITGNILSAYMSPNPALGASGAVFGIMAGFFVFLNRNEWLLGSAGRSYSDAVTQTLLINIVIGAVTPMIDNWGHLGGALGGAAMAWFYGPRLYLIEMPDQKAIVVDKPIMRLPTALESVPSRIASSVSSVTNKFRPIAFLPRVSRPWTQRSRPNYSERRMNSEPPRSIKPKPF